MQTVSEEEKAAHDKAVADRFARLPKTINAPTRDNTMVLMPIGDGRVDHFCLKGIIESIPQWKGFLDQPCCSNVALARIKLATGFLRTPFEWSVWIDSDIGFTAKDFGLLMQFDATETDLTPLTLTGRIRQTRTHDFVATAPYAQKDDTGNVIESGMGFCRVHRSVFEVLRDTLCVTADYRGAPITDFFPQGSLAPGMPWVGEDSGFWILCQEIGVIPRKERRTNLVHVGRAEYRIEALR